jgi:hypothetical protein
VPVTGVRSLLDWASTTVAPPISDIANRTVPKIFLIVEFLRLLFPRQRLTCWTRAWATRRAYCCYVVGSVPLSEPGWVSQMYGPAVRCKRAPSSWRMCGLAFVLRAII